MKAPTGKLAFAYRTISELEAERDRLRAEVEALRKDAERYQWLIKGAYDLKGSYWLPSLRSHDHQNPTEAIDAAMAAKDGQP